MVPQPFPKYVAIISVLAAVFGALNTAEILTLIGPKIGVLVSVLSTVTATLSHSLTGTGGKPAAPPTE